MKTVRIYFTSDIHGYFYPTSYGDTQRKAMGLFACADQFYKDENTLVIDGGDILQGSAFSYYCNSEMNSPEIMAEIMNDCGYDYYTLGNHDFNYGLSYLKKYQEKNHGKCVCQNIEDLEEEVLFPYDIRIMPNGIKVGLVGIVTDYVNIWEKKENLKGIRVTDPFSAAKKALEKIKDEVDLTICIYHGGFECDLATGKRLSDTIENVGYKICKDLAFDVLLTGHQHMSIEGQYCHGTYVVQSVENGKEFHRIKIDIVDDTKQIRSNKLTACKEMMHLGASLEKKYQSIEKKIQYWLDQPIGHLSHALLPADKIKMALFGTPIADFLNSVQLYFSKAQISSVGLANEITGFQKEVSVRNIIATYPYPNTLIVCAITGKQLKAAMERSAEYFELGKDNNICVAKSFLEPKIEHYNYDYYMGVTYEIVPTNAIGDRIHNLCYQGIKVKDTDCFTICLNNYRYSGAGGYPMYPECKLLKEINVEMTELIMEYFRQNPYVNI